MKKDTIQWKKIPSLPFFSLSHFLYFYSHSTATIKLCWNFDSNHFYITHIKSEKKKKITMKNKCIWCIRFHVTFLLLLWKDLPWVNDPVKKVHTILICMWKKILFNSKFWILDFGFSYIHICNLSTNSI